VIPRTKYIGLDATRFFAATAVTFYHLGFFWWEPTKDNRPALYEGLSALRGLVSSGWVGVEIFFVISGFVIAMSAQGKTVGQFVLGRAMRLYPAAWVCASITLLVAGGSLTVYLRSLVLWPVGPWIDGAYWTLAIEIVFYTLVAVVLGLWGDRALLRTGQLLGLYSTAFYVAKIANNLAGRPFDPLFLSIENNTGYLLLLHFGCYFALGMMLWFRRWILAAGLSLVCLFALVVRSHAIMPNFGPGVAHWIVPPLVWLVCLALIVASIIWQEAIMQRFGKHASAFATVGLMTYPLYLIHSELGRTLIPLVPLPPYAALLVGLGVVYLTAWLVLRAEVPIRAAIRAMAPQLFGQKQEISGKAAR